ncbi:endospore germination permease [Paenibacillus oryzisoli]|uniref:GerAB/ArcD/ProY family transporter n=1 Tax=Paenibacillus oryzisoli TaxID=1850517 RepID=UPI003D2A5E29
MNRQEQISLSQLYALFIITIIGSAIVNIPQPLLNAAHNGAWISILLASLLGIILLCCIHVIYLKYPDLTIFEYAKRILGKWLGTFILIPFLSMPLILLPNIIADIGVFFTSTMMKETPNYVFNLIIIFTAAMTVKAGIEVMARLFTFLLIIMCISVIIVLALVLPLYHTEFLLPMLPDGWKPVIHGAYISSSFPFTDVVFLSVLLPFTRKEQGNKTGSRLFIAFLFATGSLLLVTICSNMILGNVAGNMKYSLYQLGRLINVGEVMERVEMLIGITLIVGSYMKASIILFSLTLGISQVFGLPNPKILIYPIGWIIFFLSITMYADQSEFIENVSVIRPLMSVVVSVIPILILTIAALVKKSITNIE